MASRKEKPFTSETMKTFVSLNDAVKYFTGIKQPVRVSKIVNLFNEVHELNFGNVSLNMAIFKTDKDNKKIIDFVQKIGVFKSEKSIEKLIQRVEAWKGVEKRNDFENVVKDEISKQSEN